MTTPTGPDAPGAQDECAACGAARWTHNNPTVAGLCPSFVELSYGTRMARFVEAAQKVARSISTVRDALQDTMRATTELYAAMQLAGLLPEEDLHDHIREAAARGAVGKHAAHQDAVATITETLDIPAELLTGPSPDGLPDHWTAAAPIRQPAGWHTVSCDKRCGGTCMGLTADPHPVGSGPTEQHHRPEADPEATATIPTVDSSGLAPAAPARLWSWNDGSGWVEIASGTAEQMREGRDRRYQAAANNDITGAAWVVCAPGDKPTGHPDLLGVPTT